MTKRYRANDESVARARQLRRNMTTAEARLWSVLRDSRLGGAKFRRQQRLGPRPYYADFACLPARLIVEADGDTHVGASAVLHDAQRDAFLAAEGFRTLRFSNADIMSNLDGVAAAILAALAPSPSHSAAPSGPLPLPRRGEER